MILKSSKAGFISFLWLLAALVIIYFLVSKMFQTSFKAPGLSKNTQKAVQEQGIDTSSYHSMMTDVKGRLNVSSQQEIDRVKQMEEMGK